MGHQLRTNSEPRNRNHMLTSIARTKHAAEMRPARSAVLAGPTTQALRPCREEMRDKRCLRGEVHATIGRDDQGRNDRAAFGRARPDVPRTIGLMEQALRHPRVRQCTDFVFAKVHSESWRSDDSHERGPVGTVEKADWAMHWFNFAPMARSEGKTPGFAFVTLKCLRQGYYAVPERTRREPRVASATPARPALLTNRARSNAARSNWRAMLPQTRSHSA